MKKKKKSEHSARGAEWNYMSIEGVQLWRGGDLLEIRIEPYKINVLFQPKLIQP